MQNKILPMPAPSSRSVLDTTNGGSARAWNLWETMVGIYSQRWIRKNGSAPSMAWVQAISKFSDSQLIAATARCMERCEAGNDWPPDLAGFVAIVGESTPNALGLSTADVISEYWRWRNDSWKHGSSEQFPWRHAVLYHICLEMRRQGVGRKMSEVELKNLAGRQLEKWAKKVEQGYSIPPVRRVEKNDTRPPSLAQQIDPDGRYRQQGAELLAKIRAKRNNTGA